LETGRKICGARMAAYRKWILPVASGWSIVISTLRRTSIVSLIVIFVTVFRAASDFLFRSVERA
jgi:hypothetical protein